MKPGLAEVHTLFFLYEITQQAETLQSTTNKWERQDSNLRRKTSTDLQSVAFDHSATLPFQGRGPPQWVLRRRAEKKLIDLIEGNLYYLLA